MKKTLFFLSSMVLILLACNPTAKETDDPTMSEEQVQKKEKKELTRDQILASEEFYFVPVTEEEKEIFWELGGLLVDESTKRIGGKLMKMLEMQGPSGAFDYCHVNAQLMTDSLSKASRTLLRRTSFKTRNGDNDPDPWETKILAEYEARMAAGGDMDPMLVKDNGGGIRYFSPILIMPVCLNCHGTDAEIAEDTKQKLAIHYPEDQATGYALGDFRGMWSINFAFQQ